MSDIWNEKNTVCWSPTKFIKEMNKLKARITELEARLALFEFIDTEYYGTDYRTEVHVYHGPDPEALQEGRHE